MYIPLFQLDGWSEGQLPPELAHTYTKLKIQVGEAIISRINNRITNSVSNTLYLPVYPVAEWIAANWWRLLYDCNNFRSDSNYNETHNLKFAGEGYFLPDMAIFPDGDNITLKWQPCTINDGAMAFIENGTSNISRKRLQMELERFVVAVTMRLLDRGLDDTPLQEDWNAVCASENDQEERDFCIACARLGRDPYDISESDAENIVAIHEQLNAVVNTDEIFSATDCDHLESTADQLRTLLADMPKVCANSILQEIRDKCAGVRKSTPWETGYEQADIVRSLMREANISNRNLVDIISERSYNGVMPERICSLVACDLKTGPCFAYDFAYQLRPFMVGRMLAGFCSIEEKAIPVSEVYTAEQKRQRAFAAELFAPAAELRSRLHGKKVVGEDTLEELATEYQLNTTAIKHQLENHQIAQVV